MSLACYYNIFQSHELVIKYNSYFCMVAILEVKKVSAGIEGIKPQQDIVDIVLGV